MTAKLPGAQGRIAFAWLVCNRHRAAPRMSSRWRFGEKIARRHGSGAGPCFSKLRAAIGRDSLPADGPLRLELDPSVHVDVELATRAIHDGESGIARQEWARGGSPRKLP